MAEVAPQMQLVDWIDDLSVRFIINLPKEELESSERICFQIEEAQWFYEDFIRPLDPRLPSMNLRKFCSLMFQHCPLLSGFSELHAAAYSEFLAYKTRVPVRGAIMVNHDMDHVVLVKGWKKGAKWSFPRGKINKDEKDLDCAIREVYEETGFDVQGAGLVPENEDDVKHIEVSLREQHMRLYVFRDVPMDTYFEPKTRKEISKIEWWKLADLPTLKKERQMAQQAANGEDVALKGSHFYMVAPFLGQLKSWIKHQKRSDKARVRAAHPRHVIIEDEETAGEDFLQSDAQPEQTDTGEVSGHFDSLLAKLRSSNQGTNPCQATSDDAGSLESADPAAALKKILSINGGMLPPPPPVASKPQVPSQEPMNPLLAILRNTAPSQSQGPSAPLPMTPMEQTQAFAPTPATPHHHHPHPPQNMAHLPPPPNYPYSPDHFREGQGVIPISQQPPAFTQGPSASTSIMHALNLPPQNSLQQAQQGFAQHPTAQPTQPTTSLPMLQNIPQTAAAPQPQLSSQKLALLQALQQPGTKAAKANAASSLGFVPASVRPAANKGIKSSSIGPSPTNLAQSPPQHGAIGGHVSPETKPALAQKETLLSLFTTTAGSNPGPQQRPHASSLLSPEPVELAGQTSPNPLHGDHAQRQLPPTLPTLRTAQLPQPVLPELTSATVTGPLNAPDFETVRKGRRPEEPSGPIEKPADEMSTITALLRRQSVQMQSGTAPQRRGTPSEKPLSKSPFQPTILKRPAQKPVAPAAAVSGPSAPQILSRTNTIPSGATEAPGPSKNALLALFSKSATNPTTNTPPTEMSAVATPPQLPAAPKLGPEESALSSIISPVSPLGSNAVLSGNNNMNLRGGAGIRDSPLDGRPSRMSSLNSVTSGGLDSLVMGNSPSGGGVFGAGGIISPPAPQMGAPTKSRVGSTSQTPINALDQRFLLGYLESVAKGGGGAAAGGGTQ